MGRVALNEVLLVNSRILVHKALGVRSSDNGLILMSFLQTNDWRCLVLPDSDWGLLAGSHKRYI